MHSPERPVLAARLKHPAASGTLPRTEASDKHGECMQVPALPLAPLQVWLRGMELGARGFRRLFAFTTLLGFLGLLPTVEIALRIGDARVTPQLLRTFLDWRWLLVEAAAVVITQLVQAVAVTRLDNLVHERAVNAAVEWRRGFKAWMPLLGATLLYGLISIVAVAIALLVGIVAAALGTALLGRPAGVVLMALCVGGVLVFLAVYLLFIQFVVVLDGRGPVGAVNLSFNLVRGHWWRTFGVLLITGFALGGIALLLVLPLAPLLDLHGGAQTGRNLLERGVLQMIGVALFGPFVLGVLYLQYRDLKLRRATAAAAPPPATIQA